jgi:fibronectin-binding autotransporter adhesin
MINRYKTSSMKDFIKKFLLLVAFYCLSGLNAQATNYYTFISGDWSTPGIWTTDPTGLTSVSPAVPGAADAVFIINSKSVTNTVTARTVTATFIQLNATLDLGTITGNNLGTVTGLGLIKISATSFPLGTFTAFVDVTGGTIEYYDVAGTLPSNLTYNNLILSNSTGAANTLVFPNGTNPTNYTINGNLTFNNTGAGSLQVTLGNAAANVINLIVNNNITITTGVTFNAGFFNAIHQIEVFGNFTNNGLVQFSNSAQFTAALNGAVNVKFSGPSSAFLSCDGLTNVYSLIVNKGIDASTSIQVNSSAPGNLQLFSNGDAVQFITGTLRLSVNNTLTRVNGGSLFLIPTAARLWIDGASMLLDGSANGIQVNGEFEITSGNFSIGNEGLILGLSGLISIDGGTNTVEKIRPVVAVGAQAGTFSMTGGVLNVDGTTAGSGSADFPRFCLPYTGQGFFMSGGILNIADPETGTAVDGGLLLGCTNFNVTSGNINLTIPASASNFNLNSSVPLFNVNINKAGAGSGKLILANQVIGAGIALASPIAALPLVINQDLTIVTGSNPVFQANNNDVSVKRNFTINTGTTYTPGNNTTLFNGTTTQFFTLNGTITAGLFNLTINKPLTVTCFLAGSSTSLNVLNDLTVLAGTFNTVARRINLSGNTFVTGLVAGVGGLIMVGTGAQTIGGNGAGRIANLALNKPSGTTTLVANTQIETTLRLANGLLDIGLFTLNLTSNARVFDALTGTGTSFDNTKMVRSDGISSAGGIRKRYNATNVSFLYPLGTASKYTPAFINITGTPNAYGFITIRAVNSEHPIVTASNQALKYHWKTSSSGFNLGVANVEHTYTYDQSDVVSGVGVDETDYVAAYYQPIDVTWVAGDVTEVDETTNEIFIDPNVFGQIIDGEFTAGDRDPSDPFQSVIAFYSIRDGIWEDTNPLTTPWSLIGHAGVPTITTPGPKNPVFVGDGTSFFHTVTVTANGAKSGNLFIGASSTIDIGTNTGHNFSLLNGFGVSGSGTLRISSSTATAVFPAGDFGLFLGNTGGLVEYYTTGTNFTIPTVTALPSALVLNGYNFLTVNPESGRTITMPNIDLTVNNIFRMVGPGTCLLNNTSAKVFNVFGSMNFQAGLTQLTNNFVQTLNVNGNFNVFTGAAFEVANTGTAVNNILNHTGSLSNNGILDFNAGSGRVCNYFSTGTGNRSISGTNVAAFTELNKFTINRGVSAINEYNFDVRGTLVAPTNDWLILLNGTAKFSRAYNLTITDQAVNFVIPSTAKIEVNNTSCILNIGVANSNLADLLLFGKLQINEGTVNIGSAGNPVNNDIEYASVGTPEIEVKGNGTLFVNGQIRRNASVLNGALIYKQAANSSVIINGSNAIATRAKLEIMNLGSVFNMSGTSTLRIVRGGGTSFGDLFLQASSNLVTGGTILCQQGGIGSPETYSIDAFVPIFNLTVNGNTAINTATARVINNPLTINGTLLINNNFSFFNGNGINVNILGNLVNNNGSNTTGINAGGYQSGSVTQITSFNSSTANQTITGLAGNLTNFANLQINNTFLSGDLALGANTNIRVNEDLILTSGTLNDGGNTITSIGDIQNSSTHVSVGSGKIICQGSVKQFIGGNGAGKFGNLTIDNIAGVSNTANQTVNNILNLNNGSLFIDAYVLRLAETSSVTGAFSGVRMIQTNGLLSDSGVVKNFTAGTANFLFPVGSDLNYMPVSYNITANSAPGSIRVYPVKSKHPATSDALDLELDYFWVVRGTGFSGLALTHTYNYQDIFVNGNEAAYVTGRYVLPQWNPIGGIPGTVNPTLNTMTLTGVNFIDGDYTCGEPSEFQIIGTLFSRNATLGGDWDDGNTWSTISHAGPAAGITPTFQIVKIASGHTVTVAADGRTCSVLTNDGTLDLNNHIFNVFGFGDGTGLLRMRATSGFSFVFPSGNFNSFTSSTGGTVEYYGVQTGTLLPQLNYNNLIFSDNSIKTLSNVNIIVNGNLTINGGVVDNSVFNKDITLFNNWNNNANMSAFIPGISEINFNGANQTIGGSASTTFDNLNINGTGVKTLARAIVVNRDININASSLDVSASNFAIDLKGNFTNNASFNARSGLITLNGSGTQQLIGGTTNTDFFDINMNNFLGAKLSSVQSLLNTLNCINGTFNSNPHLLVLKSSLTTTGRIAALTTGDFIGNITMQRLAPGGLTGWAILGTPVQNAKINQWTDNFPTSGFVGASGIAGTFISIYTYLEFDLAPFGDPTSYAPITNASVDNITPGLGYWTYLGTGQVNTADILIDVTGPTTKGSFDFGVSFSSSGSINDDGFNLVANPYPSAIDWDSPSWVKTNVDDAIYMWQADLGQYATYISGVSTNGASNLIPSSQGFYIKANANSPVLQANENVKVAGNPTFIRSSNSLTEGALFRATIEGNNFKDEAVVRFAENATMNFDSKYDAVKLFSSKADVPSISSVTADKDLSINTLPMDEANLSIPIRVKVGVSGNYSLSFEGVEIFDNKACVVFEDLKTGIKTDIRDLGTFQFYMDSYTTAPRFIIHITKNPTLTVDNATCSNLKDGSIEIKNINNISNWSYLVKDNTGTTVAENTASNNTIAHLAAGSYHITYNSGSNCALLNDEVIVGSEVSVNANFTTSTPVEVAEGIKVDFTSSASPNAKFVWNFGDGESVEGSASISHVYKYAGNYNVSLTVNEDICVDELAQTLTLVSDKFKANDAPVVTRNNDQFIVNFNFETSTSVSIQLVDVLGKEVSANINKSVSNDKVVLPINHLSEGVYFVNINYNGQAQTTKVIK